MLLIIRWAALKFVFLLLFGYAIYFDDSGMANVIAGWLIFNLTICCLCVVQILSGIEKTLKKSIKKRPKVLDSASAYYNIGVFVLLLYFDWITLSVVHFTSSILILAIIAYIRDEIELEEIV